MKRVLFACVGNSCRSQMAEGFARHRGAGVIECQSGGTQPAGTVDARAIKVMRERGIDIAGHQSKAIDLGFARRADLIVVMGCKAEEACPAVLLPKTIDWNLDDPVGRPVETFREVRDTIETLVAGLLDWARESRRDPPGAWVVKSPDYSGGSVGRA